MHDCNCKGTTKLQLLQRVFQRMLTLQRLRAVQMEAVRPPLGTHQPPEPAQLRLHRLRRHQHLYLRLRPLRPHRNAETDI